MKILILCIADGDYVKGANIVIESFKRNIANPEGHDITFRIDEPNHDFDYLSFMNHHHAGTRISLCRFRYFNESIFDRIIYIDSDMEVVGNIDLLISNELNSKPYWVTHVHGYENYYGNNMKTRNVKNSDIINGGLQVINKPLLSAEFNDRLVKGLIKGNSFDGSDQGYITELFPALNIEIGWLEDKYNYCLQDSYRPNISDIRINHYTGTKLWQV